MPSSTGKNLVVLERDHADESEAPKGTFLAGIDKHIHFDAEVLSALADQGCWPVHHDLLVVAAAVEAADRRWKRPLSGGRTFNLTLPVSALARWQDEKVSSTLGTVLRTLTGDAWHFHFVKAKQRTPFIHQDSLLPAEPRACAVAYSDGLDSRAVAALCGDERDVLKINITDSSSQVADADHALAQMPFKLSGIGEGESSFRSRAFKFAAVATIAAQLVGIRRIVVPESGQGALGTVLCPLHNVYPDYRNHPRFLRRMEAFLDALLACGVVFEQPRLWFTKGQTLHAFLDLAGKTPDDLIKTRSCWQKRRVVNTKGKPRRQCGLCAACLLRRMSLHAAGVIEPVDTYVVSDLTLADVQHAMEEIPDVVDRNMMMGYGCAGVRHLQHLADLGDRPDHDLHPYAVEIALDTRQSRAQTLSNLRTMLQQHAREWRDFLHAAGPDSFLNDWTDGGRYD